MQIPKLKISYDSEGDLLFIELERIHEFGDTIHVGNFYLPILKESTTGVSGNTSILQALSDKPEGFNTKLSGCISRLLLFSDKVRYSSVCPILEV